MNENTVQATLCFSVISLLIDGFVRVYAIIVAPRIFGTANSSHPQGP